MSTDKFKVILVDNYDRDTVADVLLKTDIDGSTIPESLSLDEAIAYAKRYNDRMPENHFYFAKAVPIDYKLFSPY